MTLTLAIRMRTSSRVLTGLFSKIHIFTPKTTRVLLRSPSMVVTALRHALQSKETLPDDKIYQVYETEEDNETLAEVAEAFEIPPAFLALANRADWPGLIFTANPRFKKSTTLVIPGAKERKAFEK